MVDIRFKRKTRRVISLTELKQHDDRLQGLALIRRGNRLSVLPVTAAQYKHILSLE